MTFDENSMIKIVLSVKNFWR